MLNLAPRLLVASPTITDPRFRRSVILLAESGDEGALGFVVNRRAPFTFAEVAPDLGIQPRDELRDASLFIGGPVSPERGWVLYTAGHGGELDDGDEIISVGDELRVSAALALLGRFLTEAGLPPFRLFLGYAGWGPNQLEEEIAEGTWLSLEPDRDLIFGQSGETVWDTAIRRLGLNPAGFMMSRGGDA